MLPIFAMLSESFDLLIDALVTPDGNDGKGGWDNEGKGGWDSTGTSGKAGW